MTATNMSSPSLAYTINPGDTGAFVTFVHNLSKLMQNLDLSYPPLIVMCIGSDRSTGDALGPLVGSIITASKLKDVIVYGTLEEPVHALNLEKTVGTITATYKNAPILAVDSCLGAKKNVGCIQLGMGSLRPGAGVHKKLPAVGHIYVTGIVNMGGFMELMVLQSTRLGMVIPLANFVGRGITRSLSMAGCSRETTFTGTQEL